jgi:hypothetical protein
VGQVEETWAAMTNAYMYALMEHAKESARRWGDKTPHHVGTMERIANTYSEARFIYVYRNPRHTVASLSDASFPHASNSPLINAEVVRYYHEVFEQQKEKIKSKRLYQLCYDDLLNNPKYELRQLCNFLKIKYTKALVQPAPKRVRQSVGWESYKGWGKIQQQSSKEKIYNNGKLSDAHISNLCKKMGYKDSSESKLYKLISKVLLIPIIFFKNSVEFMWLYKYPFMDHMFLNKIPDRRMISSWFGLG